MVRKTRKRKVLKEMFIDDIFDGDKAKYIKARKDDYCKVQFQWSCWIDTLCKNGDITQERYSGAIF